MTFERMLRNTWDLSIKQNTDNFFFKYLNASCVTTIYKKEFYMI